MPSVHQTLESLPQFPNPWKGAVPPTPFYLYSEDILARLLAGFRASLPESDPVRFPAPLKLHFAMKSNSNPRILQFLQQAGVGADLVSGGELRLARQAGFLPEDMVFSGVGKTNEELELALCEGVGLINVESGDELNRLGRASRKLGLKARIAFRVNPDVDAKTHPYISTGLSAHKFGVSMDDAWDLYRRAHADKQAFEVLGVSLHIGSQLMDPSALDEALTKTIDFARRLRAEGIPLEILDAGGGLGVDYRTPRALPDYVGYGEVLSKHSKAWFALQGANARLGSECGRAIVAQAGALVTRVLGSKVNKGKQFLIVDGSMTELLRPSLYQAYHPIEPWCDAAGRPVADGAPTAQWEVVGPVCESADVIGAERALPAAPQEGDLFIVGCAGAYGAVMASHYNARPLPAEWWVDRQGQAVLTRAAKPAWE